MMSPASFGFRRPSDRVAYRLLEILPGLAVWLTLGFAVVVALAFPLVAIIYILLFDVYWVIRVFYVMGYVMLAYRRYTQALKVDWLQIVRHHPDWRKIYHLIVLPTYGEPIEILRTTLQSLVNGKFPADRLLVVLATEGREADRVRPIAAQLRQEFRAKFCDFLITEHPDRQPGEIAGKGANIAWAGRRAKERIDDLGIPYEDIIVSTFDADSAAHPQYFSYLTQTYLTHPDRLHTSYQPVPLFHNNIWDAMALMRVVATSTTFWLLSETMRPDRLFTFSSHSMPFQALVDVGFWQADVVTEDSRIFLQCFIRYDGRYTVTPMYIPISMDTIQASTAWRSFVNQYKQIRRWAYGVENFPYMVWNFSRNKVMSPWVGFKYIWNQLEGTYSWATAPLLILILGWLPFQTGHLALENSVLAQNAPIVLQRLMLSAMGGLAISAVISTVMLPRRQRQVAWYQWVMMVGQWLLLPVTMIIFGSLPAIEAQTRLMLGKYLGFWVSEKTR